MKLMLRGARPVLLALSLAVSFEFAGAQETTTIRPTLVEMQHDTSTDRLSSRKPGIMKGPGRPFITKHRVLALPPLPPRTVVRGAAARVKSVGQRIASTPLNVETPFGFDGVGDNDAYTVEHVPSDTTGAIGHTQYVQWVNEALQVFDRQGKSLYGPAEGRVLWDKFGGRCEELNDGDPIVQYDKMERRWMLAQFAVKQGNPFMQCVAVSTGEDATGIYHRYALSFDDFNDYPKIGVWPDAYYISFNMYTAVERRPSARRSVPSRRRG